ncbi:MAG: hypothetical protein HC804_14720 [Anaerolineae bacterium]|nr:hypothetical protein [Anaerolineae bacterium]
MLTADSLDAQAITFNGQSSPATDFSDAPSSPLTINANPFDYTFTPYSITLLRLELDLETTMLPIIINSGTAISKLR